MKSIASMPYNLFALLIICVQFNCLKIEAQNSFPESKFGIRAGGNANSWTNELPILEFEGDLIVPDDWQRTFGGHAGIYVNIRLSSLVALEPAIMYTQKGTGTVLNGGGANIEGNVKSAYLDLPLLLRLYVADGFNIFLGPQFSYHLNSDFELIVDGDAVIIGEDITDDLSEFDISPVLGIGYEFPAGFNINLSGELGLLTVDGFDQLKTYKRNIRLSVGYNF